MSGFLNPTSSSRPLARRAILLVLLFLLVVLGGWLLTFERIRYEERDAIEDATRQNASLTRAFEQQAIRTLQTIDQTLRFLRHQYRWEGARLDLKEIAGYGLLDPRMFQYAAIVDEAGRLAMSSTTQPGRDLSGRDYFVFHRDTPQDVLNISVPTQSVFTGLPVIHLTRRISAPNGDFRGVALVAVASNYLTDFTRDLDVGPRGQVMLVGTDGIARARRIGDLFSGGDTLTDSTVLARAARQPEGSFVSRGRFDGVQRLMSYRKLYDYPLVAAVGTAMEDVLRDARARRDVYLAATAVATLIALVLCAGLLVAWIRQAKLAEEKRRASATYEATFDQAAIGIAHVALDGRYFRVNPRYCALLGYGEGELLGRSFAEITGAAPNDTRPESEKRYVRKDGSEVWVSLAASLVRDAAGKPDYLIALVQDITARKHAEAQLAHHVNYDALTELPNRALFHDRLAQAVKQAQRQGRHLGVLFVDLDRFNGVNETLGHAGGDRLLQDVARRIASCVRTGDTVARTAGDEFALVAAELAQPQDAALIAQKLADALGLPFNTDGHEVFVAASVGIAVYPVDGAESVVLAKNAEAALRRAKELGGNGFQFYAAAMNERAAEKMVLENDLRRALERGEFRLHFQPKASLADGRITGFEALLRWERPGHGLISPGRFVPLLEETGLIVPVGDWVVQAACAQLAGWRGNGFTPLPVAVNLAAKQFLHRDIFVVVEDALARSGVAPRLLEVEITESDAMQNPEKSMAMLRSLKALGVRVYIDDFGTGYSSLSYLKRFPADAVKLDGSFVRGLPGDAEDASIALAVITMAHSLGLKVVAEGVETEAQRAFLAANGCDEMQGYLLGKPAPAAEMRALLGPLPALRKAGT